ncbi:MAG: FAD-dependent oxidoreductase, partial [Pontimonas sp.]
MTDYRGLSLWHESVADDLTRRPPLSPAERATKWDVIIMGAGYTGLWTALSLIEQSPTTKILILEKEIAGFGASGRNGGWVSALFPASTNALIQRHGAEAATAMR